MVTFQVGLEFLNLLQTYLLEILVILKHSRKLITQCNHIFRNLHPCRPSAAGVPKKNKKLVDFVLVSNNYS